MKKTEISYGNSQRAKIIRAERRRRGMTQKEMADALGFSVSYISALERGDRTVSWKVGSKLYQEFGVSCDFLMDRDGKAHAYADGSNSDLIEEKKKNWKVVDYKYRLDVLTKTMSDTEAKMCYDVCKVLVNNHRAEEWLPDYSYTEKENT